MTNYLQRIGSKPITYKNASPPRNWALLSQRQVKYVEYVIVTRYMSNLGVSRREVIQKISDIGQVSYYYQAENHLDNPIREKRLTNLKRHGQAIKSQATTTERS